MVTIGGTRILIAAFEFAIIGRSSGVVVDENVEGVAGVVSMERYPLLTTTASGYPRMHDRMLDLLKLARTVTAIAPNQSAERRSIAVLTNPWTVGALASFASVGDMIVGEPRAVLINLDPFASAKRRPAEDYLVVRRSQKRAHDPFR